MRFNAPEDIPFECYVVKNIETCIKDKHNTCMDFFRRQLPFFVEHEARGEIPECLKAFYSDTDDEEFPTLQKLDDELNKLLKNH